MIGAEEKNGSQDSTDSEKQTDSCPSTVSTLLDSQESETSEEAEQPLRRTRAIHPPYQPQPVQATLIAQFGVINRPSNMETETQQKSTRIQPQRRNTI